MSQKRSHKNQLTLLPNNQPSRSARLTIVAPNHLVATEVFDTYWRFAAERQAIFFAVRNACVLRGLLTQFFSVTGLLMLIVLQIE